MDHLTDPLTVAAALATAAVVCCEIEVGDWGEGGIAEKLFWPLQSAVTAPLGRKDRLQRCTTPGVVGFAPISVEEYFLCRRRVIHTREEMPGA